MIIWISANLSSTSLTLLSTFSIEPIQWIIYFTFCIFSSKISNWKNCFYFSAENFYLVFISCIFGLTSCNTVISAVLHSLTEKFWHLALFPHCCFSWRLVTFSRSFYVKQIWFGFWIFWIAFLCKLWVLLQSSGECCCCCCCCCFSRWSTQLGSDHKFYLAFCGWSFQYHFSYQSFALLLWVLSHTCNNQGLVWDSGQGLNQFSSQHLCYAVLRLSHSCTAKGWGWDLCRFIDKVRESPSSALLSGIHSPATSCTLTQSVLFPASYGQVYRIL